MTGAIYILRNKLNGKCYVGQTIHSMQRRFSQHRYHGSMPIGGAIRKYGEGNFGKFEFTGIPYSLMDVFEQEFIRMLNSVAPNGYNLHLGGQVNRVFTDETRKKISRGNSGKVRTAEQKERMSAALKGRVKSATECKHISEALKGKPKSEKHKRTLSISRKRSGVAKGFKNPSARMVMCLDTREIFKTMQDAAKRYGLKAISNICSCCTGLNVSAAGHLWAYYDENNPLSEIDIKNRISELNQRKLISHKRPNNGRRKSA